MITNKINYCILVVAGDVDKPSTKIFSREIQSSHVNLAMHGMILFQRVSHFSIDFFQLCDGSIEHRESI